MSGRKSSEVASVLKAFEDSQDKTIAKYSKDIENLIKECEKISADLNDNDNNVQKIKNSKEELYNQIKKNREESKNIRNNIKNKSHYCDEEYRQATNLKNENNRIEKSFSDLSIDASNELTKLNLKYNKKLEDFWKIEIEKLNNKLKDQETFYNIKAYCIDNSDNYKLTIEEFLKLYTSENLDELKNIIAIKTPASLEEATNLITKGNKILGTIENKALNKLKKFETEIELCSSVCESMESLGFEVEIIPIMNGKNIIEGYKMSCHNGDNIDFTNIKIDEDGNPVIEIDHHSGKNYNNCSVKWNDIKNKFNELGIPMTTVRKNGNDIIYGNQTRTKISSPSKVKGRG
ncbi:hypothetical protein [Cetobacterium sp. SF1]|uniref:hypothetical protein n=1 Tax=unclassified Cetobacterium TaxID=2630983 RepID=UPI003CF67DC7